MYCADYDPCINYNTLNDSWRNILSYGYIYGSSAKYDDTGVNWDGWYRLFLNGLSAQMPEWCVSYLTCGGFSSLWLAGSHPRLEDGVVTRDIYGSYFEQCSYYRSDPIQVKACPGNYYVYKFTRPDLSIPSPAYCSDFSETCESSSGSMSVSRCQLFEAGFSADILHLNDPSCKGTVRNGRVEFHFDNNEHICGTNLVANGTHFIYDNFILGTPRTEGLISREKILKLSFSCAYPQTQTLSMNVEINPLERCPNPNDDTVELLQNGVSTSSGFSFRMFIFTANSTKLYLHCAVQLCLLSSNHCSVNCNSGQHWRKRRSLDFHDSSSISMGPLMLSEGNTDKWVKDKVKTLAEKEDFDKYMNNINKPRDHFKSFIRDEVRQYITDKFSVSVLHKMKENTELLQQKIMKAAHESTEHVQEKSGDVGLWLKSFTQQLSDELIFSEEDLSGVKHDDVDDFNLLENVVKNN
ncbi:hypothetical protein cypCar_00042908 [Cyprinus carpio]|nr:hypothetical protein cypCar_00042908 [Cyprinus carpio]